VFHFLPAIVRDLETTQWGYEASQQVLFSADGFQQFHSVPSVDQSEDDEPLHLPGQCLLTTAEAPELLEDIETQALLFRLVHFGLRFIDPAYTQRLLHELLEKYPTRTIAPSHGFLIVDPEHDLAVFRRVNEFAMKGMYEPTYSSTLTR
jgi:flavorubredoxin